MFSTLEWRVACTALNMPRFQPNYRGTSLITNSTPPQDHRRALGIAYCRVLGGRCFL